MRRTTLAVAAVLALAATSAHATAPGKNGPIAFSVYGEIYTVQPDGSAARQVIRPDEDGVYDFSPSWGPDGTQLVTQGQLLQGGFWTTQGLLLFAPDGTGLRRLLPPYGYVELPAWSPDGSST